MVENKHNEEPHPKNEIEYITDTQAKSLWKMFRENLRSYKEKEESMTDRQWLAQLFRKELPEITDEEIQEDAKDIVESIEVFDKNLESINQAAEQGISKERWLAQKLEEASVGVSVSEYGQFLQSMDDILYQKNLELEQALSRSSDGQIMMGRNLDGNIAEHMIANTAQISANLQSKNIKVEVLESYTANSVDVRATNLDTGKYQNYQLKFGKDAQATIDLIERGNYNNQRIIVPTEQLEEVQAHFKAKGSNKTISDHIEAFGAKGQKFTKAQMKQMQTAAQQDGIMPSMDYSHYQTKDLTLAIGKSTASMALQSAAVTTGVNVAYKICNGEYVDPDELVEIAIKTGADTTIKTVTAGTLQVAIRKGIISFIPKATPAGVIANIACVGIENIKILSKIASGELSLTKGLDHMGRTTTSMVGGLCGMAKGAAIGAGMTAWIPVIGAPLAVVTGLVGGMVGYAAGSKVGDMLYGAAKKVVNVAKSVGKAAWEGIKSVGREIGRGVKSFFETIFG